MTTRSLYPDKLQKAAATAPHAKFERQAHVAQRMYGGASYSQALDSFHNRFEAAHQGDRETLEYSRRGRAQHEAFFRKLNVDPKDAMFGLGKLLEYESFPRSAEDRQKIAERTFEGLRMDCGSTEAAMKAVEAHKKFLAAYETACPYFAQRATANGAGVDPHIVRLGATYGASLK